MGHSSPCPIPRLPQPPSPALGRSASGSWLSSANPLILPRGGAEPGPCPARGMQRGRRGRESQCPMIWPRGVGSPEGVTHREGAGAGLCPPRNFPSSVKQSRNFHRNFHRAPVRPRCSLPRSWCPLPLFYRPLPHFHSRLWGFAGSWSWWLRLGGVGGEVPPNPPDPSPSQGAPEAARGHTGLRSPMSGCGRTETPCGYRGWAGHSPYPPGMPVPHGTPLASQTLSQFPQRAGATLR